MLVLGSIRMQIVKLLAHMIVPTDGATEPVSYRIDRDNLETHTRLLLYRATEELFSPGRRDGVSQQFLTERFDSAPSLELPPLLADVSGL